jgi:hypothetical protein
MLTAVLVLALAPVLADPPKAPTAKRDALGEFAVTAGAVTFNNFVVGESLHDGSAVVPRDPRAFRALAVRGTFRNPSAERAAYTVVVYGLTEDGEVEWACQFAGVAEPENVGLLDGQVPVLPGTLKKTPTFRVRAAVGPAPLPEGLVAPLPVAR